MNKKRRIRRPKEFWVKAIERMKECENISALAVELGVGRRHLYEWRYRLEPKKGQRAKSIEAKQRQEIAQLKRLLGEKALELDFFKGALQKVEARRRNKCASGEKASTTKSER